MLRSDGPLGSYLAAFYVGYAKDLQHGFQTYADSTLPYLVVARFPVEKPNVQIFPFFSLFHTTWEIPFP